MKKIAALIILLCTFGASAVIANAAPIYTYSEDIPISDSIMLTKVEEFYSDHNLSYSYIKADLSDENTTMKLLTSNQGTDVLDTVANLASTEENVVAALNADFFSTAPNGKAFALGIQIEDNKLTQSPINPTTMATISYIDEQVLMSYLDFHIMAVAPNGEYNEVRHLNKHTTYYGDILMYTSDVSGGMSPAPGGEVVEVVVSNGIITEFRRNMPPVEIPEDGCVLVVSEGVNMFLANNFNVGDEIKFDYYITPAIYDAETAFGGGAILVSYGNIVTDFSHVISGYQPRSAIGVDKSGKTLYLVAVNGRQEESRGMTMSELANLMSSLGCYHAVNLDGGGSTNMQASTVWYDAMHKVNSPTENRKVINAVGLIYENPDEEGIPEGIMLENEVNSVFIDDSVKITSAVYDGGFRPLSSGLITWATDSGTMKKNVFYPSKGGKAIVSAKADDAYAETEIFVLDNVDGIDVNSHVSMKKGETFTLDIGVFDNDGHYAKVNNADSFSTFTSNRNIVSISGKTLTANGVGNAIITIKKGNAVSYISVDVGSGSFMSAPPNDYITDDSEDSADFAVGVVQTKTDNMLSALINTRVESYISKCKSNALIGNNSAYSAKEDKNALYITLDTSKGGIRNTNSAQWDKLASAISNTSKDNIFILSDYSIFSDSEFENDVIRDYLASLDKNVAVITRSERNTYKNINGVKYFTLADTDKEEYDLTYLDNRLILEFSFDDELSFRWKNLY